MITITTVIPTTAGTSLQVSQYTWSTVPVYYRIALVRPDGSEEVQFTGLSADQLEALSLAIDRALSMGDD